MDVQKPSTSKAKKKRSSNIKQMLLQRMNQKLMKKLQNVVKEIASRTNQQAIVVLIDPTKPNCIFGNKPMRTVMKDFYTIISDKLEEQMVGPSESAKFMLPPLIFNGVRKCVNGLTQCELRSFIPYVLKYSTGRMKVGWGRESFKPVWWPRSVPWENVRFDKRSAEVKEKFSYTFALRLVLLCCYKYHGREDLLNQNCDQETCLTHHKKGAGTFIKEMLELQADESLKANGCTPLADVSSTTHEFSSGNYQITIAPHSEEVPQGSNKLFMVKDPNINNEFIPIPTCDTTEKNNGESMIKDETANQPLNIHFYNEIITSNPTEDENYEISIEDASRNNQPIKISLYNETNNSIPIYPSSYFITTEEDNVMLEPIDTQYILLPAENVSVVQYIQENDQQSENNNNNIK